MRENVIPTVIVVKNSARATEVNQLRLFNPGIEVITEKEQTQRIKEENKKSFEPYKKKLRLLSFSEKLAWYSQSNSQEVIYLGNNPYFQHFWKWHVLIPLKFKRFYYRVKNREIFKKYQHISEIKKRVKPHSI